MTHFKMTACMTLMIFSCGKSSSDSEAANSTQPSATTLAEDVSLSSASINSQIDESLSALSDQSSGLTLALVGDKSSYDRSCEEKDMTAVVSIESSVNRTIGRTRGFGSLTSVLEGQSKMTRTWSKELDGVASAVECNTANTAAKIDWQSAKGLNLVMEFERSRTHEWTLTTKRKTKSKFFAYEASGKRDITWNDNAATSDDGSTYSFTKTIMIEDVSRKVTTTDKNGDEKSVSLTLNTKDGAPLKVTTERSATDASLVSRLITSGTIVGENESGLKIETFFSDVKVTYESSECSPVSGTITSKIYEAGSDTALKSYTVTLGTSSSPLVDSDSGSEADSEFSINPCDPEDMQ